MKRMLLALLLLAISNVPAVPQPKDARPETPGTTRVAVVNIGHVFNNYHRAQQFKKQLEADFEPFKVEAKRLTGNLKAWENAIAAEDFKKQTKEEYQEKIINGKRQLEDLSRTMQEKLGKKQEQNLVTLWQEVQEGIKDYATDNKIDLILGYGDPLDPTLMDQFANINRKMQAMDSGGTVPLFHARGVDVAPAVTELLNKRIGDKTKKAKAVDLE